MEFFRQLFARPKDDERRPVVVIFAGGMGTQIIQAAVYYELKRRGRTVYADLGYFARPQKLATVGNAGELTHWGWQLDWYGITPASLDPRPAGLSKRNAELIADGRRMTELGLEALSNPEIKRHFTMPVVQLEALPAITREKYLCIHIRRGDYVNVASHLISDAEFLVMARKFAGLIDKVVILSDSPIESAFRASMAAFFDNVEFLDNIDAVSSHCIMRLSRVLFCSNSTFSLTAAMLNSDGLALIPRRWFGEENSDVELPIHARNLFEVLETTAK